MRCVHTFRGRWRYLMLGTGALVISSEKGPTTVPLSVIAEVRTPELPDLEIVLTDGEVHRIDGLHPAATEAFAVTLTNALPEQRNPAGSSLVTAPDATPVGPVPWGWIAAFVSPVLTYIGYAIWVGLTHGSRVVGVIAGGIALLLGLLMCFAAVENLRKRRDLTRRGTTVEADQGGRTKEGLMYYYNDAAGVPHLYVCGRNAPTIRIFYDPKDPRRAVHETWAVAAIAKESLILIPGLVLLVLGAWGVFGLFW
ncbi:hypothetical protein AB0442_10250 [Kitasatospora sp. NPDC085895]|uniref:hypothetical protein n=1 Tax=Kitasatospora sp. NPDC085895 TaxID=3155057 RepID=UPI00344C616D